MADHVAKRARALHAPGDARGFSRSIERVNEDERLQLFGLLPKWIIFGRCNLLLAHAARNAGACESILLHALFELFGCDLGKLQRDWGVGHEAAGRDLPPR